MKKRKLWIGVACCILAGCAGSQIQADTEGIVTEKTTEAGNAEHAETEGGAVQVDYDEEGNVSGGETETEEPESDRTVSPLAARFAIPERWTEEIDLGDGSSVTADAEILLPDVEKIPVYTVTNKSWEPEFVQQMGDALLGGEASWYEMGAYLSASKEKRGDLAPAKPEWKLKMDNSSENTDFNSIVRTGNGETRAVWANKMKWENHEFYIQDMQEEDSFVTRTRNYDWGFGSTDERKAKVEETCSLSAEEAVAYGNKCLEEFPVPGFYVRDYTYASRNGKMFEGSGKDDAGYFLACERKIDGIPVTFDYACGGAFEDADEEDALWWNNELLMLFVNDRGVVAAEAYNFYDTGEKTQEDVQLLPFEQIRDIFVAEKQAGALTRGWKHNFHVNQVRLGYFRTFDPGVGSLTGKLVPVWDFYGSWTQSSEEQGTFESDHTYASMCTINAVDGTVIRRSVGY